MATRVIGLVILVLLCVTPASAALILWTQNGQLHERITRTTRITWLDARAAAETRGGYCVTVTSAAEQQALFDLLGGSTPSAITGWAATKRRPRARSLKIDGGGSRENPG